MLFTSALKKRGILKKFIVLSLSIHAFVGITLLTRGDFVFSRPVTAGEIVMVALDATTPAAVAANPPIEESKQLPLVSAPRTVDDGEQQSVADLEVPTALKGTVTSSPVVEPTAPPTPDMAPKSEVAQGVPERHVGSSDPAVAVPVGRKLPIVHPPLRTIDEFLSNKKEKLTYRLSMLGMPVGHAVLEAKNEGGDLRLSLRVTSNEALSALYPVDDLIESRHIAGNFIISKIRQHEGNYRSNRGFTISLRDKKVFWINLQNKKSSHEVMPNSEVLDLLSGLYHLRLKALVVGKSHQLHLYDSDAYAQVPVDILRQERIRFNGQEITTLVVCPRLPKEGGIFRRTGDMYVWLSDDDKRVPLKVETTIALGRITAELIAAEVEPGERAVTTAVNSHSIDREIIQ